MKRVVSLFCEPKHRRKRRFGGKKEEKQRESRKKQEKTKKILRNFAQKIEGTRRNLEQY